MHEQIIDQAIPARIHAIGNDNGKQHQERHKQIAGHNAHDAPSVKVPCRGQRHAFHTALRIGKEQKKRTEKNGSVHAHITGPDQIIQRIGSDIRCQPALLPEMEPGHNADHQDTEAVQFRNPLASASPYHPRSLLSVQCCLQPFHRFPDISSRAAKVHAHKTVSEFL